MQLPSTYVKHWIEFRIRGQCQIEFIWDIWESFLKKISIQVVVDGVSTNEFKTNAGGFPELMCFIYKAVYENYHRTINYVLNKGLDRILE